jgi:hypothetical protein
MAEVDTFGDPESVWGQVVRDDGMLHRQDESRNKPA